MFKGIDFYSDTLTKPTAGMRKAIAEAEVGDEQKGEDPTTLRLEEKMAALTGHSSAMFFPCATMANEVAIKLHCEPGDEVLAYEHCHLFFAEAGGPAVHAGAMTRPIVTANGVFTAEQVKKTFRYAKGSHYPVSKLLSIENTTNMGGGVAWPINTLQEVLSTAKELGMKTHLDGARLFNAAVRSNVPAKKLTQDFDSATICLSKGLGCPAGAVLCFDKMDWVKVRRMKQLFGGALRQSGILAAAGLYAIEHHIDRLAEDHENATLLAERLSSLPGMEVENPNPSTNMIFFRWTSDRMSTDQFLAACESKGVRFSGVGENRIRAVLHLDISRADVETAWKSLKEVCARS